MFSLAWLYQSVWNGSSNLLIITGIAVHIQAPVILKKKKNVITLVKVILRHLHPYFEIVKSYAVKIYIIMLIMIWHVKYEETLMCRKSCNSNTVLRFSTMNTAHNFILNCLCVLSSLIHIGARILFIAVLFFRIYENICSNIAGAFLFGGLRQI